MEFQMQAYISKDNRSLYCLKRLPQIRGSDVKVGIHVTDRDYITAMLVSAKTLKWWAPCMCPTYAKKNIGSNGSQVSYIYDSHEFGLSVLTPTAVGQERYTWASGLASNDAPLVKGKY